MGILPADGHLLKDPYPVADDSAAVDHRALGSVSEIELVADLDGSWEVHPQNAKSQPTDPPSTLTDQELDDCAQNNPPKSLY